MNEIEIEQVALPAAPKSQGGDEDCISAAPREIRAKKPKCIRIMAGRMERDAVAVARKFAHQRGRRFPGRVDSTIVLRRIATLCRECFPAAACSCASPPRSPSGRRIESAVSSSRRQTRRTRVEAVSGDFAARQAPRNAVKSRFGRQPAKGCDFERADLASELVPVLRLQRATDASAMRAAATGDIPGDSAASKRKKCPRNRADSGTPAESSTQCPIA